MTELQQYLAEEVAEDHADGIITRREAIRRLGLLGLGATAASSLLAGAAAARTGGGHGQGRGGPGHGHADGTTSDWAPLATTDITFPGPNGTLLGKWASAAKPRGGVLVIHENRGLTPHIAEVAGRFAGTGFAALALDLLSEEGGTGAFPGGAAVAAALASIEPTRFDNDMKAAVSEIARRVGRRTPLSAIGFCFGGGMI